jgi:hypothetical protein
MPICPSFKKNSLTRPDLQLCHQFLRHFGVIVGGAVGGRASVGVSAPGGVARAPEGGRRIRVHHIAGLYLHHPGRRAQPAIEYEGSGGKSLLRQEVIVQAGESLLRQGVIAQARELLLRHGSHCSGRESLFRQGVIAKARRRCSGRESLLRQGSHCSGKGVVVQAESHCSGRESLFRHGVIAQAGSH